MADVLALGYGTVAGTRAAPQTLLSKTTDAGVVGTQQGGLNFVQIANLDTANWLFVKSADDPGPFVIALPGQSALVARGPSSANNLKAVVGFATTPSEAGTISLTAAIVGKKLA